MSRKIYYHLRDLNLIDKVNVSDRDKVEALSFSEYWSLTARGRKKYQKWCVRNGVSYPMNASNPNKR